MPFFYVALCLTSLTVHGLPINNRGKEIIAPIVTIVFLVSLSSMSAGRLLWSWTGHGDRPKDGVPDEVNTFLRSHIKQGDSVQPLDWTGGAVHGMLMARAPLATRFMYDFEFYHHVSEPYIQALRREFMSELSAKKPRFVVEVLENKPWPRGSNTTMAFPELTSFLERYYVTAQGAEKYRILERVETGPPGRSALLRRPGQLPPLPRRAPRRQMGAVPPLPPQPRWNRGQVTATRSFTSPAETRHQDQLLRPHEIRLVKPLPAAMMLS
jgi:hypothetical protein